MSSIAVLTSKLDLYNQQLNYVEEFTNILNDNRGRDSDRISEITPRIFITSTNDILKTPYDAEFHQRAIGSLKKHDISLIIKIGKNITSQQIKRFNAKNIEVKFMESYKNTDIEKMYDDMLQLYVLMKDRKILFVCDDGSTLSVYTVLLYFLYVSYITKMNTMDQPTLLKLTDINYFMAPRILEFIMITKKDVLENRVYLGHLFSFEMNLKFYATQKIYDKMYSEKFDESNIDYSEISSYKSLMTNVRAYLKYKKSPEDIEPVQEKIEIPLLEDVDTIEIEKDEPVESPKDPKKHNLDLKFPIDKDTDLSIINYLF